MEPASLPFGLLNKGNVPDHTEAMKCELSSSPGAEGGAGIGISPGSEAGLEGFQSGNDFSLPRMQNSVESSTNTETTTSTSRFTQLRHARRLAMNRETARARRARKKALLQTLEKQVKNLEDQSREYQRTNKALLQKVNKLEADLALAQKTSKLLAARMAVRTDLTQQLSRLEAKRSAMLLDDLTYPPLGGAAANPSVNLTSLSDAQLSNLSHEVTRRRLLARQLTRAAF